MNDEDPVESLLNVLNSFRSKILTIREMCENSSKFNEQEANSLLNEGIFDLIKIKNLNEIVQINCENKKDECNEMQDIVGKEILNEKKYQYHLDLIENDIYTNQQLPKLPESYKENDYEEILNEIEYEITNSIDELNFEKLTNFIEYYKEVQKEKIYNQKVINILNDLDINKIIENIINEEKIYFELNKDDKINLLFLNIMSKYTEFSNLFQKNEEETKMFNDINSFINHIPYCNINIFDINDDYFREY